MKIVNVTQGSPEWHAFRADHFTASDAPAMMGASKYKSRNDLLREKLIGPDPVDEFTQRLFDKGHKAEAEARPIAEEIIGDELFPVTAYETETGLDLAASFDGLTLDGTVGFEHKLYSESLAAQIRQARELGVQVLDDQYLWQLEQQLLVSRAEKILFMCSDGTINRCEYVFFTTQGVEDMLVQGWRQFGEDLRSGEPVAFVKPAPIAKEIDALPRLELSVVGSVAGSNLAEYKQSALAFVESINTSLESDQDFADAEKAVKFCKKAEDELKEAKDKALNDTADIAELFRTVDELSEALRQKRLTLDKKVKAEKERIKREIVQSRRRLLEEFVESIASPEQIKFGAFVDIEGDFAGAIKGKRTIESITNAADDELARAKIKAKALGETITNNLAKIPAEFESAFHDAKFIASKPGEDFDNLLQSRIANAKAEAEARKQITQQQPEEQPKAALEAIAADFDKTFKQPEEQSPKHVRTSPAHNYDFIRGYTQALRDYQDQLGGPAVVDEIIKTIKEKGAA